MKATWLAVVRAPGLGAGGVTASCSHSAAFLAETQPPQPIAEPFEVLLHPVFNDLGAVPDVPGASRPDGPSPHGFLFDS